MQKLFAALSAAIGLCILSGCGGALKAGPPNINTGEASTQAQSTVPAAATIITRGAFSEYVLPNGIGVGTLVNGPGKTIWFVSCGTPDVERMAATTGTIATFRPPSSYGAGNSCGLSSISGSFWYSLVITGGICPVIARLTPTGAFTFTDGDPNWHSCTVSNSVLGSDGNVWFAVGDIPFFATQSPGTVAHMSRSGTLLPGTVRFTGPAGSCPYFRRIVTYYYVGYAVASGSDGNVYVAANAHFRLLGMSPCNRTLFQIFKISTSGNVVAAYPEDVSTLSGEPGEAMVLGPDRNIWFIDSARTHIARMTSAGVTTHFAAPHPPLSGISPSADGALWFSEDTANKIGQISTSGRITEYSVPFNGLPSGIVACPNPSVSSECGPNGGAWFIYALPTTTNIVRFNKP